MRTGRPFMLLLGLLLGCHARADSAVGAHPGDDTGSDGDTDTDTDADGDSDTDTAGPGDGDGDGYTVADGDCDDGNAAVHPGAAEACDTIDSDCNGIADDGTSCYDDDGDGYAEDAGDCDDANSGVHPGAGETCDSLDNDCNGIADDTTSCYDDDGDGYTEDAGDCDDSDPASSPAGSEAANGLDDDCDGTIDEGTTGYDDDGDCWCEETPCAGSVNAACAAVAAGDCDDSAAAISPEGIEQCDGLDNNCDGATDGPDSADAGTWYRDADEDGHGDVTGVQGACSAPVGYVTDALDCDDRDADVGPGAVEVCDAIDNDCDGTVDEDGAVDARAWYVDADSDTFGDFASPWTACDAPAGYVADDTDCDDGDVTVHPGAIESCATSADDDCDGDTNDLAAIACTTRYYDGDGDGYGGTTSECRCAADGDYDADNADDCDDTSAGNSPAVTEVCDRVDNNCDGTIDEPSAVDATAWYADADLDGYGDATVTVTRCAAPRGYAADATDCDDGDASVSPGAPEVCSDGIDNDCDGETCLTGLGDLADADAKYEGDGGGDYAGYAVSGAGDVNADGFPDLLVGASGDDGFAGDAGAAYLVLGSVSPASESLALAVKYTGEAFSDVAGRAVAGAGDVDADGYADFLVSSIGNDDAASYAGAVYLLLGGASPASASLSTAVEYTGEAADDQAGVALAGVGDVDGDGYADFLVGAPYNDDTASQAGAVYLLRGSASPTAGSLSTKVEYRGEGGDDHAGLSVAGPGDVDGDGVADMLVGADHNDDGATTAGAAYLVLGSAAPVSANLSTALEYTGEAAGDYAGISVSGAGDVDGDGYIDILVGAYFNNDGAADAGAAYLVRGSATPASASLSTALEYTGEAGSDYAGIAVSGAGDADADGYADFVVGAAYDDAAATNAGAAYLVLGSPTPASTSLSASIKWLGGASDDFAGHSLAGPGDVDGDGYDDVLVGAYGEDGEAREAGAAYLVLGAGM